MNDSTPQDSFTFLPLELQRPEVPDVWTVCPLNIPDPVGILHLDGTYSYRSLSGVIRGQQEPTRQMALLSYLTAEGQHLGGY